MLGGGERAGRRLPVDRVGGLVLAMIAGALVPAALVSALAARDPLPRDCRTGPATTTTVEGALLYSTGSDLWYSEGYPGKARRLADLAPHPVRPGDTATPSSSPSTSASPTATSSASPSASPSATASPTPKFAPAVVAADISTDRKLVAYLVTDAPGRTGSITLFLVSPLDAAGTAPVAPWSASLDRGASRRPTVRVLDNGKVLFSAPVQPAALPSPSPAPSPVPSPSPSSSPAPTPSATTSSSPASSPAPTPSASPALAVAVAVVAPSPTPTVAAQAPEAYFLAQGHKVWPETRNYRLPANLPRLEGRVDGTVSRVAGLVQREVGTPLAQRRLNQVVLGRSNQGSTKALCAASATVVPTGFSPDDGLLALFDGHDTLVLDLAGDHAASRLLAGRLLSWR